MGILKMQDHKTWTVTIEEERHDHVNILTAETQDAGDVAGTGFRNRCDTDMGSLHSYFLSQFY